MKITKAEAALELEVDINACDDDIRSAYKVFFTVFFESIVTNSGSLNAHAFGQKKAFEWHPDRNRGKPTETEATEKFQRISAAYQRLTEVCPCILQLLSPNRHARTQLWGSENATYCFRWN